MRHRLPTRARATPQNTPTILLEILQWSPTPKFAQIASTLKTTKTLKFRLKKPMTAIPSHPALLCSLFSLTPAVDRAINLSIFTYDLRETLRTHFPAPVPTR